MYACRVEGFLALCTEAALQQQAEERRLSSSSSSSSSSRGRRVQTLIRQWQATPPTQQAMQAQHHIAGPPAQRSALVGGLVGGGEGDVDVGEGKGLGRGAAGGEAGGHRGLRGKVALHRLRHRRAVAQGVLQGGGGEGETRERAWVRGRSLLVTDSTPTHHQRGCLSAAGRLDLHRQRRCVGTQSAIAAGRGGTQTREPQCSMSPPSSPEVGGYSHSRHQSSTAPLQCRR